MPDTTIDEMVIETAEEKQAKKRGRPKKQAEEMITEENVRPPRPNVHYSDDELKVFYDVIVKAKAEAHEELRMLKERLDDIQNIDFVEETMMFSMHMAEQGSEAQEKEKTYAQVQRLNEYIKKLDEALIRIKEKTYGICRVCGVLIAKQRLMAVPITTLSASYKIHQKCPDDGIDKIEPVKR